MSNKEEYDTSINVLGGLDSTIVLFQGLECIRENPEGGEIDVKKWLRGNLRSEKSLLRIERMMRTVLLTFKSSQHRDLLRSFFSDLVPAQDREIVLFWHLVLNSRLFREISTRVFAKAYFSGRAVLSKDDVVGYLKEFLAKNKELGLEWSESTITTLATKYLNFMTKLNLLTGARRKAFRPIRLSGEALTLFLYLSSIHQPEQRNIFTHELLPLCFIPPGDLAARLKKLSTRGAFTMEFNGVALNIDLTLPYGELPHVLYR